MVILVAVFLGSVVAYLLYNGILNFFLNPYCTIVGGDHCSLYVTGPLDGFALRLKISIFGGDGLGTAGHPVGAVEVHNARTEK